MSNEIRVEIERPANGIAEMIEQSHGTACDKGWWDDVRSIGEQFMNFHAELSEAWEEFRNGRPLDEIYYAPDGKPEGIPVELADVLIRIFDTCGAYGIPLARALEEKMAYNQTRPHRHGGKVA